MKIWIIKILAFAALLVHVAPLMGQCLSDLGPYENEYGFAIFPFRNSCDEDVSVALCVKSWPPGSDEPAYNLYSGILHRYEHLNLTDGKYNLLESYKWAENAYQSCPFE